MPYAVLLFVYTHAQTETKNGVLKYIYIKCLHTEKQQTAFQIARFYTQNQQTAFLSGIRKGVRNRIL